MATNVEAQTPERAQALRAALEAAGQAGLTPAEARAATGLAERAARRAPVRQCAAGQAQRHGRRRYALAPAAAVRVRDMVLRVLDLPTEVAGLVAYATPRVQQVVREAHRWRDDLVRMHGATLTVHDAARGVAEEARVAPWAVEWTVRCPLCGRRWRWRDVAAPPERPALPPAVASLLAHPQHAPPPAGRPSRTRRCSTRRRWLRRCSIPGGTGARWRSNARWTARRAGS